MNKKLLKISLGIGIPVVVAGVTTGLVLGLKKNGDDGNSGNQHIDSLNAKSVKYFQNNIESHMQNAFLFPRNGKKLLDKFILIGKDKKSQELFYSPTEQSAKKIVLDFKKYSKLSEINEALTSANKALWDFQADSKNAGKRWGLEWSSNSKRDSININIYRVKDENAADKTIIDNYIKAFNNAKASDINKWVTDARQKYNDDFDFVRTLAGTLYLHGTNFKVLYPFKWNDGNILDTEHVPLYKDDAGTKPLLNANSKNGSDHPFYLVGKLETKVPSKPQVYSSKSIVWKDGTKMPFQVLYASGIPLNTHLTKEKIIPLTQPILKFDETNPSKLSLLFTFYKVGANSSVDFRTYSNPKVINPENIYTRTVDFNINDILDGLSSPAEKAQVTDSTKSRDTIFNQMKSEWIKFISNTTATSLLPMMSDFIPTIGTSINDMISTFKFLKSLKEDSNLKIDGKDTFEYIFKEKYGTKNNSLIAKILEKINKSNYFEPTQMFNVWFKDFNANTFSDLDKFTNTDTYYTPDASVKMSSQKQLYYFFAGINAFEPLIRERLNDLVSTGKLTVNFYDEISKNVINDFISVLKKKNIIASTFKPTDLNNESTRNEFIAKVVQAVMDKKQIHVPAGLFGVFIKDTNITSLLANVVNSDYASDILKLIAGNDTVQVAFTDILKDPLNAIITRLMNNVDSQQNALNNLKGKVDLKKIIKPLLGGDDKYSNIINGLIDGFAKKEDLTSIADSLSGIAAVGVKGILESFYDGTNKMGPISIVLKQGLKNSSQTQINDFLATLLTFLKDVKSNPALSGLITSDASISTIVDKVFDVLINKVHVIDQKNTTENQIDGSQALTLTMLQNFENIFSKKTDQEISDLKIKFSGTIDIKTKAKLTTDIGKVRASLSGQIPITVKDLFDTIGVTSLTTNQQKIDFFKNTFPTKQAIVKSELNINTKNIEKISKLLHALV